ncbi:hypothetical protein GCM10022247_02770 [Allokutzneria multivorans]|uniref:Uncharacterized protein n=1 Tax=Allokutzneria multivorans TaxID=1142134 RepID=A0ABP7QUQ8_9PSEU
MSLARNFVAVLLAVGVVGGTAPAASAAVPSAADSSVVVDCGFSGCSYTFSRSFTKNKLQPAVQGGPAGVAGVLAAACSPGGPIAAAACAALGAVWGMVNLGVINVAAANNQCAAIHMPHITPVPAAFIDESGNCHDN